MAYIGTVPIPQSNEVRQEFLIDVASQSTFYTRTNYVPQFIEVYKNGLRLQTADFTATDGYTVTLATPAVANDVIAIEYRTNLQFNTNNQLQLNPGGSTVTDSAGNDVLSESGGVVTLDADNYIIDNAGKISSVGQIELQIDTDNNQSGTYIGFSRNNTTSERLALFQENGDISFYEDTGTTPSFFWDASAESLGIGTTSPAHKLHVKGGNLILETPTTNIWTYYKNPNKTYLIGLRGTVGNSLSFYDLTADTERMRIDSSGNLLVGKESPSFDIVGAALTPVGEGVFKRNGAPVLYVNRGTDDGDLIRLFQDDILEGNISVSGSAVSYNGGHLSRWSQLTDNTRDESIVKGTVMSNLDQMAEWTTDGVTEENEQLNCMKVSDVEGDINVAGVFVNWDNDDDIYVNDMNIAMTGDMVIRIAQGTTVQRGDLLMSAGDGTAKPQGDDIVRSKTIAKVTSTYASHTYEDGSYLVPCVLMAC
jgi:hypothetical protein